MNASMCIKGGIDENNNCTLSACWKHLMIESKHPELIILLNLIILINVV